MKLSILLFTFALMTIHCGKGEPVEYANACKTENNKKYIQVSGILEDKGGIYCSNTSGTLECGFKLLQKAGDEKSISSDITVGTWSNNVERIDGSYKRDEIKIRDNNGEFVKLGETVKLSGEMKAVSSPASPDGMVCYLKVYQIDR